MPASSDASNTEKRGTRESGVTDTAASATNVPVELDDFGLPVKKLGLTPIAEKEASSELEQPKQNGAAATNRPARDATKPSTNASKVVNDSSDSEDDEFKDAPSTPPPGSQGGQDTGAKQAL